MKMWFWARMSRCFFSTSIRRSPTVRVLLKLGESPVVSVSMIKRFILLGLMKEFILFCGEDIVSYFFDIVNVIN